MIQTLIWGFVKPGFLPAFSALRYHYCMARRNMLSLPPEVVCTGILTFLSVRDLQAIDTAVTNTYLRSQVRNLWKAYRYESHHDIAITITELIWLCNAGVTIIGVNCTSFDGQLVECISSKIPNLKKLSATLTNMNFYNLFKPLSRECANLEELRLISSSVYVSNEPLPLYRSVCEAGIVAVARKCRRLHTLYLDHCYLSDVAVQALCDHCPHLLHIGVRGCSSLALRSIATAYPHLQSLDMKRSSIKNDTANLIASRCHELRLLHIDSYRITVDSLTALYAANPNLVDIDISDMRSLSSDNIASIFQYLPQLQRFSCVSCDCLTDSAIIRLSDACPHIASINIANSQNISDAALIALAQHSHALTSLDISNCCEITDIGVVSLARGCSLLRKFYGCALDVTDNGVVALGSICCDLRQIDLSYCSLIGYQAICSLVENCLLLSELHLTKSSVDDACLHAIAQNCRNLTYLDVKFCNISHDCVETVRESCWQLTTLKSSTLKSIPAFCL